jgi:Zn-dependent protease with chaperone function
VERTRGQPVPPEVQTVPVEQSPWRAPRPNPFVLPSDTAIRFMLLITSVVGASLFILYWMNPFDQQTVAVLGCLESLRAPEAAQPRTIEDALRAVPAHDRCFALASRHVAAWMLGGLVLLSATAVAFYWLTPAVKIRRLGLLPLTAEDAPEAVPYLAELCREAGLASQPTFLFAPLSQGTDGSAFGRLGRYYVALHGGLVTRFYTDRSAFRAIVLHELAHLRNRDVDRTYFTIAVWNAFLVVTLVPFLADRALRLIARGGAGAMLFAAQGWRVLALALLVYLIRNAVLRARETYADARASVWDGPQGALARVIAWQPGGKRRRRPLDELWRVHPAREKRLQALGDTGVLFRLPPWEASAVGVAAAVAVPNVEWFFTELLLAVAGTFGAFGARAGTVFLIAPLVTLAVGVGIWRAAFWAAACGRPVPGVALLGACLGLGLTAGEALSLTHFTADLVPRYWGQFLARRFVWDVLLVLGVLLVLRWIASSAAVWLAAVRTPRELRWACALGLVIASGALALYLDSVYYLRGTADLLFGRLPAAHALLLLAAGAFAHLSLAFQRAPTLLVLAGLVAFPFVPWARRTWASRASGADLSWMYLDPAALAPAMALRLPHGAAPALRLGAGAGLAFCGALLLVRVLLRLGLPEAVRGSDEYRLAVFYGGTALAALVQAGVALVLAGRVTPHGALHGTLAAFVAGCVMTVGVLVANVAVGGTVDAGLAWLVLSQTIGWGALLAVPCAAAASAVGSLAARPSPTLSDRVAAGAGTMDLAAPSPLA